MIRDTYLKKHYGITVQDYNRMLRAQGGACAICRAKPVNRRLNVDHDHVTQRVRGLLCFRCNKFLIGRHRDPWLFEQAAKYLRRKKALGL